MAVTTEASSAANARDVIIFSGPSNCDLPRMNKPAAAVVNERRQFTFTDIANKAFRVGV
jgi:hypothetical protein